MRNTRIESVVRTAVLAAVLGACVMDTSTSEQSLSSDDRADLEDSVSTDEGRGPESRPAMVRVMTRNLYLGADLAPVIGARDLNELVAAAGGVLRQVTATNFPVRAKGLADEIHRTRPDLVGLQEVALWRTGPPSLAPLAGAPATAETVRYDFLELLLAELNACGEDYQPVVVQPEFDLEAPADENGVAGDGPAPIVNAELNGRLTMRDVILVRVDRNVEVSDPRGGTFENLLELPILTSTVRVTRGWTSVDARVARSVPFRFVNTHLEAFDPPALVPSIRALQASELVARTGPASSELPVILLGDLNSDDDTVAPGDRQAYQVLLDAGFVERSTGDPLSCCINSFDLRSGTAAEFDHQVDHIMTNAPGVVRLVRSVVTGREMVNGYWNSDHAGVFSQLQLRPPMDRDRADGVTDAMQTQ